MTLFTTWINFREEEPEMEVNTLPSETQPDEVLTVREMLERHVRGLPLSGADQGVYIPEEYGFIPDIRTLDLTEIDEYRQSFKDSIQRINNPEPVTEPKAETDEGGKRPAPQSDPTPPEPPKQPQA